MCSHMHDDQMLNAHAPSRWSTQIVVVLGVTEFDITTLAAFGVVDEFAKGNGLSSLASRLDPTILQDHTKHKY